VGALDASAIERVRDEVRPDPRDPDECHDALLTCGYLFADEIDPALCVDLAAHRRATRVSTTQTALLSRTVWVAAERLPEWLAVHPETTLDPSVAAPPSRAARSWTPEAALVELLRGRLAILGPVTAVSLAESIALPIASVDEALLTLESEGVILRGSFTTGRDLEWCDRRLLARIHRYTLNRLRAEIAPVSPAEFMRFLFAWQHVGDRNQLTGIDGLRAVIAQLDGLELPARTWERDVLPARLERYESSLLDTLCLTGEVGWARLSIGPTQVVGATPIALFLRAHASHWFALCDESVERTAMSETAKRVLAHLRTRGASFAQEVRTACGLTDEDCRSALGELVAEGLIASDGFAGLRAIAGSSSERRSSTDSAGRWSLIVRVKADSTSSVRPQPDVVTSREDAVKALAWSLLTRYGVVFRRLLARDVSGVTWRDLVRVYRTLEARGEIRGGRFVSGMPGEQYALPDAVDRLREVRRAGPDDALVAIGGADPLNLTGIVTLGDRIRAAAGSRVVYRNGIPVMAMEGDMLRTLADVDAAVLADAAAIAAGRRVPVSQGYVGRVWP
jgi:ATP-dependent Lhr-like helicase